LRDLDWSGGVSGRYGVAVLVTIWTEWGFGFVTGRGGGVVPIARC
jgi:hypothetical protein